MKKNLSILGLLLASAAILLSACKDIDEIAVPDGDMTAITITVPAANLVTRATDPGVEALNENRVETVDLFFYPTGQTEEEAVARVTVPKAQISTTGTISTITAQLSMSKLRQLFGTNYDTGTDLTCEAFAIVNLPSSLQATNNSAYSNASSNDEITSTKVSELKKLALTCTDFGTTDSFTPEGSTSTYEKCRTPLTFVMCGQNSLSLDNTTKRFLSGNIDVDRAAAKVTVELTEVAAIAKTNEGTAQEKTWHSQQSDITVRMRNGQDNGFVNAPEEHATSGYFDKKNVLMQKVEGVDGNFITETPLYTYPNKWETDITHRSSLTICIYWREEGTMAWTPIFYEIPIDDQAKELLRNTHYKLKLKIGVVGSLVEEEPLKLKNCSYTILPWGTNDATDANLDQVRYLMVNKRDTIMNNIISLTMDYATSHDIDVYSMKLEARDLRSATATWTELVASNPGTGQATLASWNTSMFRVVLPSDREMDNVGNKQLIVEHDLVNNGDENCHYTAFRMTFTIRHKDNANYTETIVVYQYPMVYADAEQHSLYTNTGTTYNFVNGAYGYERTGTNNGTSDNGNTARFLGGNHGLTGSNKNPNRYYINATSLKDDKFIIGDPRTAWVNNELTTANIGNSRPDAYGWSYAINTSNNQNTTQSWPRYSIEEYRQAINVNSYGSFSNYLEAQAAGLNPTRNVNDSWERYYAGPSNWDNYTSEASAYAGANNYYYWRTIEEYNGKYYYQYHIARYTIPNSTTRTRYVNTIKYYHPTEESQRTVNMIAPSYMVASSYGVCTISIGKEKARRRCASYQEDGYPAGRWRLPTSAEVLYICQLTAWGKIPMLFGSDTGNSYYWTANGVVRVNPSEKEAELLDNSSVTTPYTTDSYAEGAQVGNQGVSVRCVYDSWYWTDTVNKTTFTWGDREDATYWNSMK